MTSGTVVSETILMISSILVASTFSAMAVTNFSSFDASFKSRFSSTSEKILTEIEIIFATNVTNGAQVWIKNVGITEVHSDLISQSDLFFGPTQAFRYIEYGKTAAPWWNYSLCSDLDEDGNWSPCETLMVYINLDYNLTSNDYYVIFVLYNGESDDYTFSV